MAEVLVQGTNPAVAHHLGRLFSGAAAGADHPHGGFVGRSFAEKSGREAVRLFVLAQLHDYGHVLVPQLTGAGYEQR